MDLTNDLQLQIAHEVSEWCRYFYRIMPLFVELPDGMYEKRQMAHKIYFERLKDIFRRWKNINCNDYKALNPVFVETLRQCVPVPMPVTDEQCSAYFPTDAEYYGEFVWTEIGLFCVEFCGTWLDETLGLGLEAWLALCVIQSPHMYTDTIDTLLACELLNLDALYTIAVTYYFDSGEKNFKTLFENFEYFNKGLGRIVSTDEMLGPILSDPLTKTIMGATTPVDVTNHLLSDEVRARHKNYLCQISFILANNLSGFLLEEDDKKGPDEQAGMQLITDKIKETEETLGFFLVGMDALEYNYSEHHQLEYLHKNKCLHPDSVAWKLIINLGMRLHKSGDELMTAQMRWANLGTQTQ